MKKQQPKAICPKCGTANSGTKRCKHCGADMFENQIEHAGYLNAMIKEVKVFGHNVKKNEK